MSVKFSVCCEGCSQEFNVDVEIPADTQGTLSMNFKDQLVAACPTCGRDVILASGTFEIANGQARRVEA